MANKFPTNQSFQRLNNSPLDETTVFDTLAQAQDYAKNNPTAYKGQVVHVKDARTDTEINDNVNIYEETCYIDLIKNIVPICSFSYEAMGLFFDIIYEIFDGPTEETRNKLDKLYEIMYENYAHDFNDEAPTGDYHTQPWHPGNYTARQLCYRIDPNREPSENIGFTANGTAYQNETIEKITVMHNGVEEHYRVITYPLKPEKISFSGAKGLLEIIHMCDTSRLVTLEETFYNCENLIRIRDINKWDLSNCKSFYRTFVGCMSLTSLDLSNWNTSNVTNISEMFKNCKNLISLNLSDWNTSNVTNMYHMFHSCESLKTIDLSHFNTSNVTDMYCMFYGCKNLTSLNLSGFDLSKLTSNYADYLFYGCEKLKYINFNNISFEQSPAFRNVFTNCDSLLLENISMTGCSEYVIQTITDRYNAQA